MGNSFPVTHRHRGRISELFAKGKIPAEFTSQKLFDADPVMFQSARHAGLCAADHPDVTKGSGRTWHIEVSTFEMLPDAVRNLICGNADQRREFMTAVYNGGNDTIGYAGNVAVVARRISGYEALTQRQADAIIEKMVEKGCMRWESGLLLFERQGLAVAGIQSPRTSPMVVVQKTTHSVSRKSWGVLWMLVLWFGLEEFKLDTQRQWRMVGAVSEGAFQTLISRCKVKVGLLTSDKEGHYRFNIEMFPKEWLEGLKEMKEYAEAAQAEEARRAAPPAPPEGDADGAGDLPPADDNAGTESGAEAGAEAGAELAAALAVIKRQGERIDGLESSLQAQIAQKEGEIGALNATLNALLDHAFGPVDRELSKLPRQLQDLYLQTRSARGVPLHNM